MGQVHHGSTTTTAAVRRAIRHSQESLRGLARRYGINPKTVAKWRRRSTVSDLRTGSQEPRSTVLSAEDEAVVVAFRRHTLLPLDDCLYALQPTLPHLTRSSLHRCLQRHGISRLPDTEGDKPSRSKSPCCMARGCRRMASYSDLGSCEADVLRASELEHAVQSVGGDGNLGFLAPVGLRA